MKKLSAVLVALLAITPLALAQAPSDEEVLDRKIQEAQEKLQQYKSEKDDLAKKKAEEERLQKEREEMEKNATKVSIKTNYSPEGKVITTTTTTTTTTTVITDDGDDHPVKKTPPLEKTTVVPVKNPNALRPLNPGRLAMAEVLGACVPGSGLAHFTLGDTKGGMLTLAITALSGVTYIGAEIAIETGALDNPDTYGILHYGSMALFLAGYLYDLIDAPIYYRNYNAKIQAMTSIKPLDLQADNYACVPRNGLNLSLVRFSLEF